MRRVTPALLALALALPAVARDALPVDFVYLRDVAPTIMQDMRYAADDNFTGRPLPGYGAPECVLRREVAQALAHVEDDLARKGLGLKVYDCYRPARAVAAMAAWAQRSRDQSTRRFFPAQRKEKLFALGYIAAHSAHSTGIAVDLTLIQRGAPAPARFDRTAHYGPCNGPAGERAPDNSLDMGTGFDCFDPASFTASAAISPEQKRWRGVLLAAMRARGFHNYFREWWHFTYGARPANAYDVPIAPRARTSLSLEGEGQRACPRDLTRAYSQSRPALLPPRRRAWRQGRPGDW
jgi:D-alanyl-D-alanine dipeptidase